jgi:hypothetical protein
MMTRFMPQARKRSIYVLTLLHKPVGPPELRAAIAANLSQQTTGDCPRRIVVVLAPDQILESELSCRAPAWGHPREWFVSPEHKISAYPQDIGK